MSNPASSAALPIAHVVLRILIVVNWLAGAAILAFLVVIAQHALDHDRVQARSLARSGASRHGHARDRGGLVLVAIPLHYVVLKRLLAIVGTVRAGDPFVAANALRLKAIAWTLLALQLLSLVIGAIARSRFDAGASASSPRGLFDQRLARRAPHVPAGPRVRRGHAHARRPRRDGLTWRSS